MWKTIGLGAALLVAVGAPGALYGLGAAPERSAAAAPAQVAADQPFVATCKANQIVDSRPDPAWVVASFGNDHCMAPAMPKPLDGYSASREQIVAGMTAVKSYAVQADAYQQCISHYLAGRKAIAEKDRQTLNMALIMIEDHRILASQADRKKAQGQIEVAINAFNEYGSECPD